MNILFIRDVTRWIKRFLKALGLNQILRTNFYSRIFPTSSLRTSNQSMNSGLVLSATMKTCIRCAGISGILAMCLGVYGSHIMKDNTPDELRRLFQLAQMYHLFHSVALLAVPLVSRPVITGLLFIGGISLFCGPMYYHAIRNDPQFRRITPYGGMLLLAGWLSIAVL